jgi:hypothetical protein
MPSNLSGRHPLPLGCMGKHPTLSNLLQEYWPRSPSAHPVVRSFTLLHSIRYPGHPSDAPKALQIDGPYVNPQYLPTFDHHQPSIPTTCIRPLSTPVSLVALLPIQTSAIVALTRCSYTPLHASRRYFASSAPPSPPWLLLVQPKQKHDRYGCFSARRLLAATK